MNEPETTTVQPRHDPHALACIAGASVSLILMVLTFWLA